MSGYHKWTTGASWVTTSTTTLWIPRWMFLIFSSLSLEEDLHLKWTTSPEVSKVNIKGRNCFHLIKYILPQWPWGATTSGGWIGWTVGSRESKVVMKEDPKRAEFHIAAFSFYVTLFCSYSLTTWWWSPSNFISIMSHWKIALETKVDNMVLGEDGTGHSVSTESAK